MENKEVIKVAKQFNMRWKSKLLGVDTKVLCEVCSVLVETEDGDKRGLRGVCNSEDSVYDSFTVQLGVQDMDCPSDVVETMIHEYTHILLSPFAEVARVAAASIGDTPEGKAILHQWAQASERACCRVAKAFKNVGVR